MADFDLPRSTTGTHEPGEAHDYRLECKVCGQYGQINVLVVPPTLDDAPVVEPEPEPAAHDDSDVAAPVGP